MSVHIVAVVAVQSSGVCALPTPGDANATSKTAATAVMGSLSITGTALVGQTLTANTTGISDSDGLTNATFAYQWLADDAEINGATGSSYTLVTADAGKAFKVRVTFTDDAGNEESLTSYSVVSAQSQVPPEPMTATTHDVPESHDGATAFTFELRFGEEPVSGLSYTTLQLRALTVTGGGVTKARRLEAPSNVRWEITVTPHSSSDVTIVLPITSGCQAQGAICTEDGRMLSSPVEFTVTGPGG